MAFIEHTVKWFKGETFEGGMLVVYGVMLVLLAAYFWRFGPSAAVRVLIVPLFVVGLFWAGAAGVGLVRNTQRLAEFRGQYDKDPVAFVESEKSRVEGFLGTYRPLLIGWSVLVIVGLALFNLWGGNAGRAVGLAVILFAVAGLMVDHTSEHNARAYYGEIIKALES